ncbi:cobyrinate a,c-diamide synthase [bacterium LRH843]|nr:cobyrinate a,c-diamide synthase [bacterium LRH843]
MTERRIVVAGTGSGVGKTTVTIGLMSALKKKGLTVQGFKCGPDYIDPTYHTSVTKRASRNLDSWMLSRETILDIYTHGSTGADISIIEGVMGFFDGKSPTSNQGSTAEISILLESPVILVVDCSSMARSAAAIVKGFQTFASGPNIVGVIANQVGSEGHFQLVKAAIEQECHIPVIGYLKRELDIEIPERSLGLIPSVERGELDRFFDQLGELILETVNTDQLLELSIAKRLNRGQAPSLFDRKREPVVKIAVAKDAAFNSYYPENLKMLESFGAELVYFSPLADEPVPEQVDGLYIGGGLPEEFVSRLAQNDHVKQSVKKAIKNGIPTFAECGGFMYLTNSVETTAQEKHCMVGIIPGEVKIKSHLTALGYREISGQKDNFLLSGDEQARGHEFHYSMFQAEKEISYAYETTGMRGTKQEGYVTTNLVAGYTQIHFASNPTVVTNFIETCLNYRRQV